MAEVHSSAAGPGSAQTAEIIYGPAVEDAVLAAGIADERFDPESLEAAIRQALAAWVTAVGEDATASGKDDSPLVAPALLRPGGPGARTRLVVREPQIDAIQFWRLDADAAPPLARLIVTIHGRRCIRDRDTGEPVSGDPGVMTWFHQFWDMARDGPAMRPWHLEARVGRDSRDYADAMGCTFTTRRETVEECRERTAAEPQSDEPGSAAPGGRSPARRFRLSCGFFEHDAYTGGDVEITVRLSATPSWNDAVQLVLPAIYTRLTRSTGQSAWRPTIASLSVLELLNWAGECDP